jgi:hypothetical protein
VTGSSEVTRIIHAFISEEVKEVKVQLAQANAEQKKKGPAKKVTKKQGTQGAPKRK